MHSDKQKQIRPDWEQVVAEAKADDRRNKRKAWSYLAMFSGGFLFSIGYKWTLQALAKEASTKNMAIGLLTCSAAASASSVALVNLLFVCKECKNSRRFGSPEKTKARESPEVAIVVDPTIINSEELTDEDTVDLSASMEFALGLKTEKLRTLSEESKEMCKKLGAELKKLGNKVDATVERLNASVEPEESELFASFSENQRLCVDVAKELKRITAEVGRAAVNLFTPQKEIPNLSKKDEKLCKDIATLLKKAELTSTPSCLPSECFFCCEESLERINEVLRTHESCVKDAMTKTDDDLSGPTQTFVLKSEIAGDVLHKQISGLLRDYERHRRMETTHKQNANVMALYRLLVIILDEFRNATFLELAAVDDMQQPQSTSQSLEDLMLRRIRKSVEKRDQNFQDLATEQAKLAKQVQSIKEMTETGSSLFGKWTNDDKETCRSTFVASEVKVLAEARQRVLNASEFPLLHAIDSPFLAKYDGQSTRPVSKVLGARLPVGTELKPVEPMVDIPWPSIDNAERTSKSSMSEHSKMEELVNLLKSGLDAASLNEENAHLSLDKSHSTVSLLEIEDHKSCEAIEN